MHSLSGARHATFLGHAIASRLLHPLARIKLCERFVSEGDQVFLTGSETISTTPTPYGCTTFQALTCSLSWACYCKPASAPSGADTAVRALCPRTGSQVQLCLELENQHDSKATRVHRLSGADLDVAFLGADFQRLDCASVATQAVQVLGLRRGVLSAQPEARHVRHNSNAVNTHSLFRCRGGLKGFDSPKTLHRQHVAGSLCDDRCAGVAAQALRVRRGSASCCATGHADVALAVQAMCQGSRLAPSAAAACQCCACCCL